MVAEIILVTAGSDEQAAKTGAQQTARCLVEAGIKVREHITVCANVRQLQQGISAALQRSNAVFLLGGVSEAAGFITKTTLSEGLDLPLEQNAGCLEGIKRFCKTHGERFTEADAAFALLPKGSVPFPGSFGKLPGFAISSSNQHILVFPETPGEAVHMCKQHALPLLSNGGASATVVRTVRTYGVSEAAVRETLAPLLRSQNPELHIERDGNDVLVRVTATAHSNQQAAALCTPVLRGVVERMGDAAYGLDVDSLQSAVVDKLQKKSLDLAVTESGTKGMLTRMLGETPGGQEILRYSISADDRDAKVHKLGLKPKLLKKHGPVSEYAAVHMANAVREKAQTSLGMAICADPDGNTGKKASQRFVFIAVCDADTVYVKKLVVGQEAPAPPDAVIDAALSRALNMLRLFVDYLPEPYPAAIPLWDALDGRTVTDHARYEDVFTQMGEPEKRKPSLGRRILENLSVRKADKPKQKVKKILFMLSVLVFLASASYLAYYYANSYWNRQLNASLQSMFGFGEMDGVEISPDFPHRYNKKFAKLWSLNPDVVAFVHIPGTTLQYPVVQTTDNEYYLRRDFYGKNNWYGIPFMDYRVDLKKPSDNLVIYGHNMRDGTLFGPLVNYRELSFYREHPVIDLSTLYEDAQYKIFSVFITNAYENQGPVFAYHDFIDAKNKEERSRYLEQVRVRSLIHTTVDVNEKDKLLTLSTCTYEFKDARLVVVARKLRRGEDATVNTADAVLNPQPLMPDIWYKTFGGTKPEGLALSATPARAVRTADGNTGSVSASRLSVSASQAQQEAARISSEQEAARIASEQEAARIASEQEAARISSEQEAARISSEQEAARIASEQEAARISSEQEAARISSEQEAARIASEQEAARISSEQEAARIASEQEAARLAEETSADSAGTLSVYANGAYIEDDALEIISRIVQSEVGASFEVEAIKAQALASYSYIANSNQSGKTPSVVMAASADRKVRQAVASVMGQGIYYNNKLAFTPYHATSAGATTSSAAVWGGHYPYLVSVDSSVDENANNFEVRTTFSRSKVESLLASKLNIEVSGDPDTWFEILSYEDGGYNGAMSVCGVTHSPNTGIRITGRMLRESIFSLRSAKFTVEYDESRDSFLFTTYGYGHGVGMSQTGANLYAQQGWSYVEILEHYYPGTSVY